MDNLLVLDRPDVAANIIQEHPDADQEPGGLVPLSEILARLLVKLDARRVR